MPRFIPVLIVILFLTACEESKVDIQGQTPFSDTTLELRLGQTVRVAGIGASLTFDELYYDGRLPHGQVDPWWSNTAELNISIAPSGKNLHLCISGEITDSGGVRFHGASVTQGDFVYRALNLEPLPDTLLKRIPDSELVLTVQISKAQTSQLDEVGFFPITVGNRWIYIDSLLVYDTVRTVTLDTIEIESDYYDSFGRWGRFSGWFSPFESEAMARGDSIFSFQSGGGPTPPGEPRGFASMELILPVGESAEYLVFVGGDMVFERAVVALDTPVTTPAGEFSGLYEYSSDSHVLGDYRILKPGLGFVFAKTHVYQNIRHRLWLVEYRLMTE